MDELVGSEAVVTNPTRGEAGPAAANDRVALDQIWIEIMPEIVEKLAASLNSSNLTVGSEQAGSDQAGNGGPSE